MAEEKTSTAKNKKLTYKGALKKAMETLEKVGKGYEVVEKQEIKLPSGKKRVRTVRKKVKPDKVAAKALAEISGDVDEQGEPIGYHLPPFMEYTPEGDLLLRTSELCKIFEKKPNLLILDEPTSGLDPNQIGDVRSLIKEIGKTRTVIISTHILSTQAVHLTSPARSSVPKLRSR